MEDNGELDAEDKTGDKYGATVSKEGGYTNMQNEQSKKQKPPHFFYSDKELKGKTMFKFWIQYVHKNAQSWAPAQRGWEKSEAKRS